jgi:hypothetical protein
MIQATLLQTIFIEKEQVDMEALIVERKTMPNFVFG